ncbi:hypothetical protein LWI28_016680 [Acer negundo]|uniref:60S acidic ribosomal protein P1 n=1 Tax=Acer negundo TaxID=4023 RepID=A0AAD5IZS1_ACENE|nr:hypothetical protein LWI28_016680 [Acer negundo]
MYEAKLVALCKEGLVNEAVKVIEEEMVRGIFVPTVQVYYIMLKGLCDAWHSTIAVRYLKKMAKQGLDFVVDVGIRVADPSTVVDMTGTYPKIIQRGKLTMSTSEAACTYAALILHDDGIAITSEKIVQLLKAANVTVESYWPNLFAKLAEKRDIDDLIMNVGSGGGGAVAVSAPVGGAAAAPAPAAEEKKEEPKEESDDDMGFSLFD